MKIIGHRGAKGLAPENTLRGFEKALEHHVDEIELDVRVTKDGQAALSHDRYLYDTAGNQLEIIATSLTDLQKHKSDLTTLDAAISLVNRRVPMVIEVKRAVSTGPVIETVREFLAKGWQAADFRFASYDQEVLRSLHQALPSIAIIINEDWSSFRARRRAKELGAKRIQMLEYWLWGGFIHAIKHAGYELYSFPPKKDRFWANVFLGKRTNNPDRIRKWAKHGLAGVITDYPDLFEK